MGISFLDKEELKTANLKRKYYGHSHENQKQECLPSSSFKTVLNICANKICNKNETTKRNITAIHR